MMIIMKINESKWKLYDKVKIINVNKTNFLSALKAEYFG